MVRAVSATVTEKMAVLSYIEVLKPLPSLLLAYIGVSAAIIAGAGQLSAKLWLILVTVLLAAAGANGLTNYLDRHIDARMERTRHRVLACGRIFPAQKALPLIAGLVIAGLFLAWQLHPLAFLADLLGTVAAATWRKKVTCVYPQGVMASCAPVLMGWFAVRPALDWQILLLCLMIALWLPLHVWSLIIAHREDYLQAGLNYFPISFPVKDSVKLLFLFSLLLYGVSIALYFAGDFAWLYLVDANLLGVLTVYASARLVISGAGSDAWRLYKLSTFPYLGLIFAVMCLDVWLRGFWR